MKIQLRSILILLIYISLCDGLYSQIGGRYAFQTSSLPTNARATALGGTVINILDDDVALAQFNPAVVDSSMHNQISINHNFHFAGIQNGNLSYGRILPKLNGLETHFAIQYVSFGTFDQTDVFGNINGEFSAGEVALVAGAGKQLNSRIRGGVNFKVLTGSYESFNAFGLGVDIGFHYEKDKFSSWALVLRNIGGELSGIGERRRALPFDLQLGYSKRLAHLPFRLTIIGHNLQTPYIRYDDPEFDVSFDIEGNRTERGGFSRNIDNLFRHLIISGEFLIGKDEKVRLRFGYDHLRRQELRASTFSSRGGFSFGVGFNIKKIKIDYGIGVYHLAGATNHISIRYDLSRINRKV